MESIEKVGQRAPGKQQTEESVRSWCGEILTNAMPTNRFKARLFKQSMGRI
jgi:hypothetical protein